MEKYRQYYILFASPECLFIHIHLKIYFAIITRCATASFAAHHTHPPPSPISHSQSLSLFFFCSHNVSLCGIVKPTRPELFILWTIHLRWYVRSIDVNMRDMKAVTNISFHFMWRTAAAAVAATGKLYGMNVCVCELNMLCVNWFHVSIHGM